MRDGFIKVAAATPEITVANPAANRQAIMKCVEEAAQQQVQLLVLPELCITGYTCGDLFLQQLLLEQAKKEWNDSVCELRKQLSENESENEELAMTIGAKESEIEEMKKKVSEAEKKKKN